ncbi:MAG: hypothetical protein NXH85_17235 [Pseudomonadaceae bacterium]|nr:hypothetical protein [Pseudomonadaceae bacterium]
MLGLVPQHVHAMQPPRALNVPFELGRPLGKPGDANYQRRVLSAALALLDAQSGPVVAEFDDPDYQLASAAEEGWACPVSFAQTQDDSPAGRLRAEVDALAPWFHRAQETNATATGTSGLSIDQVLTLLLGLASAEPWAFSAELAEEGPFEDVSDVCRALSVGDRFKLACEDLKMFYTEAIAAQPKPPSPASLQGWFWGQTEAGALLQSLKTALADNPDKLLRNHARFTIVPAELH